MKIREQFKKDLKKFIKTWSVIIMITTFILCVGYSYMHFLIDTLKLPLIAPERDGRGEFIYFWSAVLYTLLIWLLWILIEGLIMSFIKIKNYVFE